MNKKKITFLILSHSGASSKQITATNTLLYYLCLAAFTFFAVISYVFYDYNDLRGSLRSNELLENNIVEKQREITHKQKQITEFAKEINTLKSKIIELSNFEKKMRVIANIKVDTEYASLFGSGGPIPDDLEINTKKEQNELIREMHNQVKEFDETLSAKQVRFKSLIKQLENRRNVLACTPSIRPIRGGWITSKFGYRISSFTGLKEFHNGLDIGAATGTLIYATADGITSHTAKERYIGKVVLINHGYGMATRFGHLDEILVKKGQKVKRGDVIGKVGNTGRSTGPHVHYEVRLNGVKVNPRNYIMN